MSEENRILNPKEDLDEKDLERSLRPRRLKDYVGQLRVKDNLEIAMSASKKREETLEHVLLYGAPGLGKTTLAHIIANEMEANIKVTSGPAIEKSGDLAAILSNLEEGDVLFIDEIHRLPKTVEEILYPAMEDFALDIIIGKGPSARSLRLDLPHFTIIGATTLASLLSSPLRDRFGLSHHLEFYQVEEMKEIVLRSAKILDLDLSKDVAREIANRSRRTPRIANRLLKRVRDYSQVKNEGRVDIESCKNTFQLLAVDEIGLDAVDKKILEVLINKFAGGPVGLSTLAAATGEERDTIENIYEPYLLQLGFINRSARGRIATALAYKHLGFKKDNLL